MKTQKEIGKRLIEVRDIMDFLDDGYHSKEISDLTKISNELFTSLNGANQQRFRDWLERKAEP